MKRLTNISGYLILLATLIFHLWLNFPETKILADPNDNIFQYSLVYRTNWVWKNYGCPFSISCLPNLVDHEVTTWAEGYPLPFYYSHLPQIATVGSYHLLVKPVISIFNPSFSLYQYYTLSKYFLLCFFPISIFLALKIIGFSPVLSAFGAFFGSNFSTDGLYGIDPPSFLWRGWGLTSQLYAMVFFPLAIAYTYQAIKETSIQNQKLITKNSLLASLFLTLTTAGHLGMGMIGLMSTVPLIFMGRNITNLKVRIKKVFAIYILVFAALSYWIIPVLLYNKYHIISFWDPIWKFNSYGWYEVIKQFVQGEMFDWQRAPIVTSLVAIGFFVLLPKLKFFPFALLFAIWFLAYFGRTTWGGLIDLVPGMKDFHQHRFLVGVQMAALFLIPGGLEYIFDSLKKTIEKAGSMVNLLVTTLYMKSPRAEPVVSSGYGGFHPPKQKERPHSSTGKTRGFLRRWINAKIKTQSSPARNRYAQSVAGGKPQLKAKGLLNNTLVLSVGGARRGALGSGPLVGDSGAAERQAPQIKIYTTITFYILSLVFISLLVYFTAKQTVNYASFNNRWIGEANKAFQYDEKNFQDMVSYIRGLPSARVYAGRPGNWGKKFRLGSTEMYMLMGVYGFDMSQFLPETWSPLSENEQNFDERVARDYDLLNIRYVVSPKNQGFAEEVKKINNFGPFQVYEAPTTGWFDFVSSPMFVKTDKTNYINLVHLWHRSYPRLWKMHPLISVEKKPNIPAGVKRVIEMKDEVSYQENNKVKNIFSDFPFVFPESTVSAKISSENVNRQTYSAKIEVPENCTSCFVMFKMSYHPSWKVKIDGKETSKFAVFPFYMATAATPGVHTVEFTYYPNSLKVVLLSLEILLLIYLLTRLFLSYSRSLRSKTIST